ncbi:MAG TPA: regulatory protein RecX [Rudaea sp.]|nr:regulatory protein RecX [Rudaea sp.]
MARRSSDKQSEPSAYEKALGLLSRREHSARELKAKLAQRGFDADENAAALERLQSKDFQNDARFGEMLVRSRIEGGYGPRWIIAELRTHGIDEERASALIAAAEPDWPGLVRRQLRRRYGAKPAANLAERTKRASFLLRRGFDASTVKLAIGASGIADSSDEAG